MLISLSRLPTEGDVRMKRDCDVIRKVLEEVEEHDIEDPQTLEYELAPESFTLKAQHAHLLWKSGFLTGYDGGGINGDLLVNTSLTWEGHELLDTLRSKPVWEKVKAKAAEQGVALSFEAVKALGK
jgi:hypothetical protein